MLDESTKLLVTAYVDGELSPAEVSNLKDILEWSAEARDLLQGQLLISRRLRQAWNKENQKTKPLRGPISAQLIIQASKERQARKNAVWPAAALVLTAAGCLVWVGIQWSFRSQADKNLAVVPNITRSAQGEGKPNVENKLTVGTKPTAINESSPINPRGEPSQGPLVNRKGPDGSIQGGGRDGTFGPIRAGDNLVASEKLENQTTGDLPGETNSEEFLGSPVGPSLSLKRIEPLVPNVVKLKSLEPSFFAEFESRGILKIDLPTYQDGEGIKRILKTLQAEGCKPLFDPVTEERLKKNQPVGPVTLTVYGMDPGKLCQAIQNTSKVVSGKPGPNQPVSVFEEAILGVATPKETDLFGGIFNQIHNRPNPVPGSSPAKKGLKPNLNQESIVLVQSSQMLKLVGSGNKTKPASPPFGPNVKQPVIVQIFPLK